MKVRAALLVVSLLPLGVASASLAATPKKVCNIVTDPKGDAQLEGVPGNDNDDILSADIATDGKNLTAVVRMAGMAAADPMAPFGRHYLVQFEAKGADTTLFLAARTYPTGTQYVYGYSGTNLVLNTSYVQGDAKGSIDTAKHEVRITVPNKVFASHGAKFPKGSKIAPTITVYRMLGQGVVRSQQVGPAYVPVGGLSEAFDDAAGKSYVVGTPSCVKPG